jgi:hypothetical protein
MRAVLVIGSAALALAACQKSPGATGAAASSDTTTTASTATPQGGPLSATPHRRSGLWSQTVTRDGKPMGVGSMSMGAMQMCVDAASEANQTVFSHDAAVKAEANRHCTMAPPTRTADGGWTAVSTCPMPSGGSTTTTITASGDFNNSYQVQMDMVATGAPMAALNGHHVMNIEGKWVGPCPAGMAGGDMSFGNGMKFSGGKIAGAAAMLHGATGGGSPGQ